MDAVPEDNLYKIILVRTYQLINQLIASNQWSYDLVMESSAQYFNRAIIWSQPAIPLVTKVWLKLTKWGLDWITISLLKDEALTQYKRAARLLECKSQGSTHLPSFWCHIIGRADSLEHLFLSYSWAKIVLRKSFRIVPMCVDSVRRSLIEVPWIINVYRKNLLKKSLTFFMATSELVRLYLTSQGQGR